MVQLAFDVIDQILEKFFPLLDLSDKLIGMSTLNELINVSVEFGCNVYTDISLQSISYLSRCVQHIVNIDEILEEKSAPKNKNKDIINEKQFDYSTPSLKA